MMRPGGLIVALGMAWSSVAAAQAATERTTNLSGDWIGNVGTIYFNLVHRFESSAPPERKVSNSPTFLLATPLTSFALVGTSYATNSTLAQRFPNEHEYFARISPLRQRASRLFDAGIQVGYNDAARGGDGELTLARTVGALRLVGAGRVLSRIQVDGYEKAYGGGAVLRLGRYVAIAGDAASLAHRSGQRVAWGAGLQFELPQTPHTMSLQVTNVGSATLQGVSRGDRRARYGFEYTIPVTLRRYARRPAPASASDTAAYTPSSTASGPVVKVHIQSLAFRVPAPIERGTTVEWVNDDPVAHSVVAVNGQFRSPLIPPGQTWRYTFTTAGSFAFACSPHPFMRGVITVQ